MWLLNRIAAVFRDPEVHLRTMPVLIGEEATGKSKFADTVGELIGKMYTHQLGTKDIRQADSFTGFLEDKIFLYATEIDMTEITVQDRLKSWSSDAAIDMQAKGKEAKTIRNPIRLIMLLSNKDEMQALNQFSESEDTRLAIFRAKEKSVDVELRAEVIGYYDKFEAAVQKAGMGDFAEAEAGFQHMRWYLDTYPTLFSKGRYDLDAVRLPVDTAERKALRITQIPREIRMIISMYNEPVVLAVFAAAHKKGHVLEANPLSGCVYMPKHEIRAAFGHIAQNDRRRAGKYVNFMDNPNGKFVRAAKAMCERFSNLGEVTTRAYKSQRIDGEVVHSAIKLPPYGWLKSYIMDSYGEDASSLFEYDHLLNEDGYVVKEPKDAELMASLNVVDSGEF